MKETLNAINETIKLLATNFICFDVVRTREVTVVESLLDVKDKLEGISNELSGIRNALERIANILETKETRALTLKIENCLDPSDGPFCTQEPKTQDKESTENEDV